MADKVTLTDKFIRSPKLRPAKGRAFVWDSQVPGLALRVTDKDDRGFYLVKRYPGSPHPAPRLLAKLGELDLAKVRAKAREWIALLERGIDPRLDQARQKAAEEQKGDATIAAVWQAYYDAEGGRLAKTDEIRRAGEAFVRQWGIRPAEEITPAEIAAYFRPFRKTAPAEGHNRFGHLRRMYKWAIGTGGFGITTSPCRDLSPRDMFGEKVSRDRILSDDELRRIWAATGDISLGPLVRLLILTGQRLNDVAKLSWSEIDFNRRLICIPARRMKMKAAHIVPLAPDALALLQGLPRFGGPFVFSTTGGKLPVWLGSKIKAKLDALSGVEGWVFHDLRRTMRSHLSALPVQDIVRELVIAHQQKGLHKVYDLHRYEDEKHECLRLWEHRLCGILAPKPTAEVAKLDATRARAA
jgi:integrase